MTQGLTANTVSKLQPNLLLQCLQALLTLPRMSESVERHLLASAYQRLAVTSDRIGEPPPSQGRRIDRLRCPVSKRSQYGKQISVYRSRARSAVASLMLCLVFGTTIPNAAAQTISVPAVAAVAVSYTHLTLPTKRIV